MGLGTRALIGGRGGNASCKHKEWVVTIQRGSCPGLKKMKFCLPRKASAHVFMHSENKYFLSSYFVLGTGQARSLLPWNKWHYGVGWVGCGGTDWETGRQYKVIISAGETRHSGAGLPVATSANEAGKVESYVSVLFHYCQQNG